MSSKLFTWVMILAAVLAGGFTAAPARGDLVASKKLVSPASGQAHVGELVNFQILIGNNDRSLSVVSIAVNDVYTSSNLEFVSAEPPPSSINAAQGLLTWKDITQDLGDLAPFKTHAISATFRAIAPTTVAGASNVVNLTGSDEKGNFLYSSPVSASVSITQPIAPDPYEVNNTLAQAKTIPCNNPVSAFISPKNDVDFFSISLKEVGDYYVKLYDLPADYNLYLLDTKGVELGHSLNKGTQPETIQLPVKTSGQWIIKVAGNGVYSTGQSYKLVVNKPALNLGSSPDGKAAPGDTLVLKMDGLPSGDPASPNMAMIYLDSSNPANLLAAFPILPGGGLNAGLHMPDTIAMGTHQILTRVVQGSTLIEDIRSVVAVSAVPGNLELWVDDAWARDPDMEMPIVNKLVPPNNSSNPRTKVDIICRFAPRKDFTGTSVKYRIHVGNNIFSSPEGVYMRAGHRGNLVPAAWVSEGGGYYSAVTTASLLANVHCVFRFRIPGGLPTPNIVNVTGEAFDSRDNSLLRSITEPRRIRLERGFPATVFLNRTTLFRDMIDGYVADLLSELYIHSQDEGLFGPHDKRATIYCVDEYLGTSVRNWDNSAVNYSTDATANSVAIAIGSFMINVFNEFSIPAPYYVLIVGNDEQFPFYRYNDPSNEELGWQSSPGSNPAMMATEHDYILTDAYYGNYPNGEVSGNWWDGNLDLVVGRIIGDGAQDMKEFYLNGIAHNGDTGRAIMASVSGWELGYEADDNRSGEIDDYLNVPGRLANRGFGVFNDGETPHTIDVMTPYNSSWASGFQAAANAGMDLFFIGGHNGYGSASIPENNFDPSDTPTLFTRFDDDNPIAMIVGCHGGLPVPDIGSFAGGAGDSMVYDVIRSGARAYYGASGYSYGSPNNLHRCLWAELLLQYNFGVLTQFGSQSTTLGYAIRQGKINYPFGVGSSNAYDVKTMVEFNLFGVPWQRLSYPGQSGATGPQAKIRASAQLKPELAPGAARERKLLYAPRSIVQLAPAIYQQTFHIHTDSATAGKLDGYDIINVPGGEQQFVNNAPLLPALTPNSIALPAGGRILAVSVNNPTTTTLANYNIPTTLIGPWTVSGITLTTATQINYLYPRPQAVMREGGQSHFLLTVFPVRHNPTTNQTILNKDFDVTVSYQAPVPYGILNFSAGGAVYGPGSLPSFSADVFNMGISGLNLSADLAIWNDDTREGISTQTLAISLDAGGVYPLLASGTVPMQPGRYGARLRVWDSAVSGAPKAAATTEFEVKAVILSNLATSYDPAQGKVTFTVRALNLGDKAGTLALAFAVSDSANVPLKAVTVPPVTLQGGAQADIPGLWTISGATSDTCRVQAVATFDGAPTNTVQALFTAFTPSSLLAAIIDHLLGRKELNQADRDIADVNNDKKIDVSDVVGSLISINKKP